MQVRDIMVRPPVTTSPELTILEAARLMRDRNIGSLIVQEGQRALGIVTERDLVGKVVAEGRDPRTTVVRDLMSSPLLTIPPETDVMEAARSMARHHVRRLPVLQGTRLLGIVTERDILEVSPDLIEVTRARNGEAGEEESPEERFLSKCEACGGLADGLQSSEGQLVCEDCWQEQRMRA